MNRPDSRLARAQARDAAMQRMRRLTFAAVAGATALAALFSGLVAKAVPGRKTATAPRTTHAVKAATATKTTIAPAPAPIVPVNGGGGDDSQSQSQAQSTPAAPAQPPAQSYAPPVVSSGGS